MVNRLTKIYTRTGDAGDTGLADGSRISKQSARVQAMGDVDELNSVLGLLVCKLHAPAHAQLVQSLQNELFNLGAELSTNHKFIKADNTRLLEQRLDEMNTALSPLKEFILPGGDEAAAVCHIARTVCRRAERSLVALGEEVDSDVLAYINRLSDLLFVLARDINREQGREDVFWQSKRTLK
jgi:cob(I)alamin adenosyltransferase